MKSNVIAYLGVWIEHERPGWVASGVDVFELYGQTIWPVRLPSGDLAGECEIFIGTVESCQRPIPVESEFVKVRVLEDMPVEQSKVLIENAVEQVAGR